VSFNDALLDLMPSTLHVDPITGVSTDGYATAVYTTSATENYRCRVVTKQELVTDLFGEQQVSNTVVWLKATSTFSASDQFSVGGSTLGPVLRVEHYPDDDGQHHSKIWFG